MGGAVALLTLVLSASALIPGTGFAQRARPRAAVATGWLVCPNVDYVSPNSGTTAGHVHAIGISCVSARPVVRSWLQGRLQAQWRQIGERYAGPFALSDGRRHVAVEMCAGGGSGCVGGPARCPHTSTWHSGVTCAIAVAVVPFSSTGWNCTRMHHVTLNDGEIVPPNVVCARRSQLLMQYAS